MPRSCNGCVHHVATYSVCAADDGPFVYQVSPFDGRGRLVSLNPRGIARPDIDAMRAPGGMCGPDAKLYRPRWYRRLFGQ